MTAQEQHDPDTVDMDEDTEDVVGEDDLEKSNEPTEPDLSKEKRAPGRIRMPSKVEIIEAVEAVNTESLEVDALTREAAQLPKVEDLD